MTVDVLVALSLTLLPARSSAELEHRRAIAAAAAAVTDDDQEQALLVGIAKWESGYRTDVARCVVKGAAGELGAWQVLPRSSTERDRLCKSFEGDARLALERIRESVRACRHLPLEERLAIYARGRCDSDEGRRLSRERWTSVPR